MSLLPTEKHKIINFINYISNIFSFASMLNKMLINNINITSSSIGLTDSLSGVGNTLSVWVTVILPTSRFGTPLEASSNILAFFPKMFKLCFSIFYPIKIFVYLFNPLSNNPQFEQNFGKCWKPVVPSLILSQTSPGFYVSAVQVLWKHCV